MDHSFTGGYELLTLDGIGHFPPREAPDAVATALIRHFTLPVPSSTATLHQ
jgi:pimeloyl-ACP methyl ester carboxylesterase